MKRKTLVLRRQADLERAMVWLREAFDARVREAGKALNLTLEDYRAPRTGQQNRLLHSWLGEIADQTGHTAEEIKDYCKQAFLPQIEVTVLGQSRMRPKGTSELSKQECIDFMERIQALAAELGVDLTQPSADDWQRWRREAAEERRAA